MLWQRLPAGGLPSSVSYLSTLGFETKATLVGIAPQVALRPGRGRQGRPRPARGRLRDRAARDVRRRVRDRAGDGGDRGDARRGGAAAALRALAAGGHGGLLPVSFPGTAASLFTGRARETASAQAAAGPYVFLYAAGDADGRSTALGPNAYANYQGETVTTDLGAGVVAGLIAAFHAPADPCADRNIRC